METKSKVIIGVVIVALVIGLILFFASTAIVPTGHIGVVTKLMLNIFSQK